MPKKTNYVYAVGRRKEAVARVRLFTQGEKEFLVNDKPYQSYFFVFELQQVIASALKKMKCQKRGKN